jgi:uncharacterized protein (TIGR02265 family)
MAGYKGVGLLFLRKLVRGSPGQVQAAVDHVLTDDERRVVDTCTAGAWVPVELVTKVAVTAAPLLYPGVPDPLFRLGQELARDNLGGIYAYIVRVLTVPFLVQQTARLWRTYHDSGDATCVSREDRSIELVVRGYPSLPERFRHYMEGYVQQAVSITGVQDVRVTSRDDDPACWTWRITWR